MVARMVERRVRRTQAERRALAEERVLDAAVVWIAEHGSSSLTLAGVGEAAGRSGRRRPPSDDPAPGVSR
jgi:hypothetical protein